MTPEEIKKIAEEYAAKHLMSSCFSVNGEQRVNGTDLAYFYEVLLSDILAHHYIVDKYNVGQMVNDINAISFPIQFGPVKQKIQVIATEMIKSDMKMVFGADIFDESDE